MASEIILVTGFPPFGNHPQNPSGQLAEALNRQSVLGHTIVGRVLPCEYLAMPPLLAEWLGELEPMMIVGCGLACGEPQIRLERVGLNELNFTVPDNGGHLISHKPILEDGPAAYFSTLPMVEITDKLRQTGIPARLSDHAGGHLCNQTLYTALHLTSTSHQNTLAGFVHLPATPALAALEAERDHKQECAASMDFDLMVKAVKLIIEVAIPTA